MVSLSNNNVTKEYISTLIQSERENEFVDFKYWSICTAYRRL